VTRRLTYPEAAAELRVEERWLRRNIAQLPHSKKGRVVTFTEDDLARIDQMHHREPDSVPQLAPGAHPLAGLRPLPARRRSA
jgi:hypothetical protein